MHKNVFTLPVSFTGSYTENKPNFPWQNDLILHKKVSGVYKVVNFKDFSRQLLKFKTFSRYCTNHAEGKCDAIVID